MTRWKNEFRKKGVKLENDYPMIPFDCGSQSVLGVYTDGRSGLPRVMTEYSSLLVTVTLRRDGQLSYVMED